MANIFVPQSPTSPPKRSWETVLLVGLGLSALALSNPSPAKYADYAAWKFKSTLCEQKPPISKLSAICPILVPLPNSIAAQGISGYTHRTNALFFSVYHTKILDMEVHTFGIAGMLFTLPPS
jgi:hypothetical protein